MPKTRTEIARLAPSDLRRTAPMRPVPNQMPNVALVALPLARAATREFTPLGRRPRSRGRRRQLRSSTAVPHHDTTLDQLAHAIAPFGLTITQASEPTRRARCPHPAAATAPPPRSETGAPSHTTTPSPGRSPESRPPHAHTAGSTDPHAAASYPPYGVPEPQQRSQPQINNNDRVIAPGPHFFSLISIRRVDHPDETEPARTWISRGISGNTPQMWAN